MTLQFEAPPRAWQRMLSGRRLDILSPRPEDIEIGDIAHGLARVARWNGQTFGRHAFSVAQHSVVVADIAAARNPDWSASWRLAALMHDAPEYVIGDLISPFKSAIGDDYRVMEKRLLGAIHLRFGLPEQLPDDVATKIKDADRIAAFFEATRLAGFDTHEAQTYFGVPPRLPPHLSDQLADLSATDTSRAQSLFLSKFKGLAESSNLNPPM